MAAPSQTLTSACTAWSRSGASKAARRPASPAGKRGAGHGKELGRAGSRPWQGCRRTRGLRSPRFGARPPPKQCGELPGRARWVALRGRGAARCDRCAVRSFRCTIAPLPACAALGQPRSALRSPRRRGTCREGVVPARGNRCEGARFCSPLFQEIRKSALCLPPYQEVWMWHFFQWRNLKLKVWLLFSLDPCGSCPLSLWYWKAGDKLMTRWGQGAHISQSDSIHSQKVFPSIAVF